VNPPQPLTFFDMDERSEERRILPINPHSKIGCFSASDVLVRVTTVKWCDHGLFCTRTY